MCQLLLAMTPIANKDIIESRALFLGRGHLLSSMRVPAVVKLRKLRPTSAWQLLEANTTASNKWDPVWQLTTATARGTCSWGLGGPCSNSRGLGGPCSKVMNHSNESMGDGTFVGTRCHASGPHIPVGSTQMMNWQHRGSNWSQARNPKSMVGGWTSPRIRFLWGSWGAPWGPLTCLDRHQPVAMYRVLGSTNWNNSNQSFWGSMCSALFQPLLKESPELMPNLIGSLERPTEGSLDHLHAIIGGILKTKHLLRFRRRWTWALHVTNGDTWSPETPVGRRKKTYAPDRPDRAKRSPRRSLGLLAQPLAAFAVLPCLGTLLVKARVAVGDNQVSLLTCFSWRVAALISESIWALIPSSHDWSRIVHKNNQSLFLRLLVSRPPEKSSLQTVVRPLDVWPVAVISTSFSFVDLWHSLDTPIRVFETTRETQSPSRTDLEKSIEHRRTSCGSQKTDPASFSGSPEKWIWCVFFWRETSWPNGSWFVFLLPAGSNWEVSLFGKQ